VRGCQVDNCWVVPHCPFLLCKYMCHFNVECITSIKCVKYIFKYIYKGHDHISMQFGTCDNEVKLYLDARWVGTHEAYWRLMMFPMHGEVPNIVKLAIHLPGEQCVTWDSDLQPDIEQVLDQAAGKDSTLIAYFKANAMYPEARELLYHEFPQQFTWDAEKRVWKLRSRGFGLGRMYYVPPTAGEHIYLRTLLTVVKVC
jgi:hypothetical protein